MDIERTETGLWAKGQSGNPLGRPKREKETAYLECMSNVVSIEHWEQICTRARDDAIEGNATARNWLSGYLLGKPTRHVQVETDTPAYQETARLRDILMMVQYILDWDRSGRAMVIGGEQTEYQTD